MTVTVRVRHGQHEASRVVEVGNALLLIYNARDISGTCAPRCHSSVVVLRRAPQKTVGMAAHDTVLVGLSGYQNVEVYPRF